MNVPLRAERAASSGMLAASPANPDPTRARWLFPAAGLACQLFRYQNYLAEAQAADEGRAVAGIAADDALVEAIPIICGRTLVPVFCEPYAEDRERALPA